MINPIRRPDRVPDLPDVARKVAGVAEVLDLRSDAALVGVLEEAVAENRRLHAHLARVVGELEQSLVPLLEKALRGARP